LFQKARPLTNEYQFEVIVLLLKANVFKNYICDWDLETVDQFDDINPGKMSTHKPQQQGAEVIGELNRKNVDLILHQNMLYLKMTLNLGKKLCDNKEFKFFWVQLYPWCQL
jgi:hypothetical protein